MNSFIFISVLCSCLLLYSAWTDGREGYIPDQVSILIFVLSLFSVLNGYGPGFLIRIAGAFFCGGLLELIRLISKGGIGMGDVKADDCLWLLSRNCSGHFVLMLSYMLAGLFCLPVLLLKKASLKPGFPWHHSSQLP